MLGGSVEAPVTLPTRSLIFSEGAVTDDNIPVLPIEFSDEDVEEVFLVRKTNYKVNVSVGKSSKVMIPKVAVLDTGAGPNLVCAQHLPSEWMRFITQVKTPG